MSHQHKHFFSALGLFITLSVGFIPFFHTALRAATCPTLQAGDLFKVKGVSSVYLINNNGERLYYPNGAVFRSWHDPLTTRITEFDLVCAGAYPAPRIPPFAVNFRPGTLLQNPSDPRVYVIETGGVARPILTEEIAAELFGSDWGSRIYGLSDVFWVNYRLSSREVSRTSLPDGMLVSRAGSSTVYELVNTVWTPVEDVPQFIRSTVIPVSSSTFAEYAVSSSSNSGASLFQFIPTTGQGDLSVLPEWRQVFEQASNQTNPSTPTNNTTPSTETDPPFQPARGGGGGGGSPSPAPTPPPPPPTFPDLAIESTATSSTVNLGNSIAVNFAYQNDGDEAATTVTVSTTIPTGTTYNSSGSGSWSCSNGAAAGTTCTHTVGTVAVDATGTVAFVLNTLSAGVGSVTVPVQILLSETDSDTADNTDSSVVTVQAPNLSVSVSSTYARVTPGGMLLFSVLYGNTGNVAATGTTITIPVPTGTIFSSASSTGTWSCSNGAVAGTSCVTTIGALAVNATATLNFAALSTSTFSGNSTSTVTIADNGLSGDDSDTSDNTDSHAVRVAVLSYSDVFVATVRADLDAVTSSTSSTLTTLGPFKVLPGTGSVISNQGGVVDFLPGVTGYTVTHPIVLPTSTTVAERYAHIQIESGDGAGETAGLFGEQIGRVFSATNGFIVRARVSRGVNNFGSRGTIIALGTNFGSPGFEPSYLENDIGYGFDSGDAVIDGYHFYTRNGTYDTGDPTVGLTSVTLGSAAPRDERIYDATIIVEAGATLGYARLADLSDPDNPVVADERTFTIPSTTGQYFLEINASPGPAASGQTLQVFRIYYIDGMQFLPQN